jgi:hypothetical protein
MFNGLIDSTEVQPRRHSSFTSSGGTTHRRHTEQDIVAERMQQWMRQIEEYQLQMHEYYRQQEERRQAQRAQEWEVMQVSIIVNSLFLDN